KSGAVWAQKQDTRVTRIGAFIRRTIIDELPQLFNVLKGDMCMIGPRPERPVFTEKFPNEIPGFTHRLDVKPGLSGWAQVNCGYDMKPK
ncbi:sugar transferase, partial [Bacillus spizizenii]|uniref:sugar transferase n=1 Tax=Bacillus spizizenii TaxID=96241 RepID=UPI001F61CF37